MNDYYIVLIVSGFLICAIFTIREDRAERKARYERERSKMLRSVSKWRKV